MLDFSNLNQILTDQYVELPSPFQSDPYPESWCHYFEKADLARQSSEWDQVVRYAGLAFEAGFPDSPVKHVPEFSVFIEGYAHSGSWERAEEITLEAQRIDPQMAKMLCSTWEQIYASTPGSPEKSATFNKINQQLGCDERICRHVSLNLLDSRTPFPSTLIQYSYEDRHIPDTFLQLPDI